MMANSWILTASIAFFALRGHCQTFVGSNGANADSPGVMAPPPGLTSICNSTYSNNVTCDPSLSGIAFYRYFPTSDDLNALCKSDCLQSMIDFRDAQSRSCGFDAMKLSGTYYHVTATIDTLIWAYNYTCYRDNSGQLCSPIFDAWANGNNDQAACSDCVLGTYQRSLNSALRYDSDAASRLSSMVSSCGSTGYSVAVPSTLSINVAKSSTSTSARPSPTCSRPYTVANGDTCHSVSQAQNVSTANLLYTNQLQAGCANFPAAGTQICLPHACDIYTVQQNDTCWSITEAFGNTFRKSQLVSWNVDVNDGCDNFEMLVGNQICISFPGNAFNLVPTNDATATTAAPAPTNVADGTNTKCSRYYTVQSGDTCASVSQAQSIPLKDFYFLNPKINSTTCDNLWLGVAYCVRAAGDINTFPGYGGSPTNPCVGGFAAADSSCYATSYVTTDAWVFPRVSSFSNSTTSSSDIATGGTTASTNVITATSSTSSSTSSTSTSARTTSSSTTSTGAAAPGPTQAGQPADCNKWLLQQSGEYCAGMASRAGISLSCLYQLNPALNSGGECQGMWVGYAYCVGTASNSCT